MLDPFKGSRLKLGRARRHINEYESEAVAYLARKPIWLETEMRQTPDLVLNCQVVVRIDEQAPPTLSAIIGDAIHNLRSALDILACDLVRLKGGDTKSVYFPFARSESDLANQIKQKNLPRAGVEVVSMVSDLRPFCRGNDKLRAIHDRDIQDKHVGIIPLSRVMTTPNFALAWGGIQTRFDPIDAKVNRDGEPIFWMHCPADMPMHWRVPCQLKLVMPDGDCFLDVPIGDALEELAQIVESIIQAFEWKFGIPQ